MAKFLGSRKLFHLAGAIVALTACSTPDRGPASLPPCLQAPGLNTTIMLGEESFCPIGFKAETKDVTALDKHIVELDEKYKLMKSADEPDAGSHLYFGFQSKYRSVQKKGKPYSSLSKQELFSIYDYLEWGHQNINRALWSEHSDNELERAEIRLLAAALNKLPSYKGKVYRGEFDPQIKEDVQQMDGRISTLVPGQPYFFKGFMSTTMAKNSQSKEFRDNKVIIYEIKSKNGKPIAPLSSRPEEDEVLFRPGTWFQVLEVKKVPKARTDLYKLDYQWLVKLEEI